MNELTKRILFVIACIVLPVVWGVLVNWLFDFWRTQAASKQDDEPIFPDYQI